MISKIREEIINSSKICNLYLRQALTYSHNSTKHVDDKQSLVRQIAVSCLLQ